MKDVDQVLKDVAGLAERFLDGEVETGDPNLDAPETEIGPEGEAYDEVQDFMSIAQSNAVSAIMAINQMLKPAHKEKLVSLFGEKAEELLKQTKECLEGIASLFDQDEEEPEEDSEEDDSDEDEEGVDKEEPEAEQDMEAKP